MEWLILRLHRKAVARLGPLTADLSDWIKLYRELLKPNKELREMIRRHKEEGKEFNRRLAEIKAGLEESRANLSRLENSIPKMSKSVSDV